MQGKGAGANLHALALLQWRTDLEETENNFSNTVQRIVKVIKVLHIGKHLLEVNIL